MVPFVLGSYWLVADHARLSDGASLIAIFCLYSAWIASFDRWIYENRIADLVEWIGAPTFLAARLLAASIVRAGSRRV